jgi:hypothetical protein
MSGKVVKVKISKSSFKFVKVADKKQKSTPKTKKGR